MASENVILGAGRFRYELIVDWAKLPKGTEFGMVGQVVVDDRRGRVYVFHRGTDPLSVFDLDGNFVTSWGKGLFLDAHGMALAASGDLFLGDRDAHHMRKFSADGTVLIELGTRRRASLGAPFNHPTDIGEAPDGSIFVTDGYGNSQIHVFSAQGEHVRSWGQAGSGAGQFRVPHSVAFDQKGRVLIADRDNHRVQLFTMTGEFVGEWRDFYHPLDIHVDAEGTIYIVDQTPRLSVIGPTDELVSRGRLQQTPHGIASDADGNLYVAEVRLRQVHKLRRMT